MYLHFGKVERSLDLFLGLEVCSRISGMCGEVACVHIWRVGMYMLDMVRWGRQNNCVDIGEKKRGREMDVYVYDPVYTYIIKLLYTSRPVIM